jgi:FkbM family methyltransferase
VYNLKHFLKRLRASQPLNYLITSTVHGLLGITGLHSEFIIKHLHRAGIVKCRLPNGRILYLWSRGDDWISNQIYWKGWNGYEPETVSLFFQLARCAQVTLDVGAFVGFYALLAAHANPAGRVYAFEPMPFIYQRLQQNVRLNRLSNIHCIASAVGDKDGTAEFFHVAAEIPCSSSLSFEFMSYAKDVRSSIVPVVTLDRFARDNGLDRIDLVKIDTESTEPQVLHGMMEILQRDHPTIFCEVLEGCGNESLLEKILDPLNYRYYLLTPDGPVLRDRIEGHPLYLNYLFTTLSPKEISHK